jgi:hypothetical protein
MKTIIKTIWCVLVLPVLAGAANYTVKSGGGGNYSTIQACATGMSAGDTCTVYAGTYNENVKVSAGSVGSYKTLSTNPGDTVYVLSFTINSHVKINGFHITNPSSPASQDCVAWVNGSTDIFITNNTTYACGHHAAFSGVNSGDSATYLYIQGNTISYACSTSASPNVCKGLHLIGDHHLIENNDISHVSDGMDLTGSHNVYRKNTFHDANTGECGSNSSNCHIDFIESEPSSTTQFNLYEGNTELNNLGSNGHGYLVQGDACSGQCFNLIIRFNVGAHVGSGGILDDNAYNSSVNPGFYNVKSYNNSWIDYANWPAKQPSGITSGFSHNSTGGAVINDLFYYPESLSAFNPYATDASTVATFVESHNLAWCTGSTCNLHGKNYGSGSFTDNATNIKADPLFVNYASNDFALLPDSPALAAGTYLTTVANSDSGSGTSLVVNDAGFFQDGYSIQSVNADCIAVTTVANHVCITAVNYQTKTLTRCGSIRTPQEERCLSPVLPI